MTWSVALLDRVNLAVRTTQVLDGRLDCLVAATIFEHLQQDLFAGVSKIPVQAKSSSCSFMAVKSAKFPENSSQGLVVVVHGIDLFIEPFNNEQAMNESGSQLLLVVLSFAAAISTF